MITAKFRYMTCHWTGTSMNPDGKGCVPSCITADKPGLTAGLKKEGAILVNTARPKEEIIPHLKGYEGKLYTIDAHKVSMEAMGKYFPNTPLLAAIVKVANIMDEETFLREMQASFKHKFASKPEVIDGNMKALEMALKEVK